MRRRETVLFGKPYVWVLGADGKLSLTPDWNLRLFFPRTTARIAEEYRNGSR